VGCSEPPPHQLGLLGSAVKLGFGSITDLRLRQNGQLAFEYGAASDVPSSDPLSQRGTARVAAIVRCEGMGVLQLKVKKRVAYGAIALIWIVQSTFVTTMGFLSTDIIKGSCVPWGVYSSYAAEKIITSSIFIIALLLPLMLMLFCYSRIVYALRYKVYYTGWSIFSNFGQNFISMYSL